MENEEKWTPSELQHSYYENLPDCDWVRYKTDQRRYLLQNIAFALFGQPLQEGELNNGISDKQSEELIGYSSLEKEQAMKVFKAICNQGKYSHSGEILMSIIMVVCASPRPVGMFKREPPDYWLDLHAKTDINMRMSAVFKIRKCSPLKEGKSCRIFVDDQARVYQSWDSFLRYNKLPKCVLIAPKDGEYTAFKVEDDFRIEVSVVPSPAFGLGARVLSVVDTTCTVVSIGTIGLLGVSAFVPALPLLLLTVPTVTAGVYGIVRSSFSLTDRKKHEQSISILNREARNDWLNIASSSVGIAAGAATNILAKAASSGKNLTQAGQILTKSVDFLSKANLATCSVCFANSLHSMISKYCTHKEKPTTLELFQFSASTLFLFSAVINNKTADQIIEETQTATISDYKQTLRSKRHQKVFDKLSNETRRSEGIVRGNTEIIRGIRMIDNKDQFFADVLKITKEASKAKVKLTITSDGNVNLNGQAKFNPAQLRSLPKSQRATLFTQIDPPAHNTTQLASYSTSVATGQSRILAFSAGDVIQVAGFAYRLSQQGVENIADTLKDLSEFAYDRMVTLSINIISNLLPEQTRDLQLIDPNTDVVAQVVSYVYNYLKTVKPMGETDESNNIVAKSVKEFLQEGRISKELILEITASFLRWLTNETAEVLQNVIYCTECGGIRYSE